MRKMILLLVPFIIALLIFNKCNAQVVLTVGGEVDELLALTMDELEELPIQAYFATSMKGYTVTYDVVRLIDVLELAGVPTGIQLRGEQVQKVVVVTASDGYKAAFSLVELDPKLADGAILLAIGQGGRPLDEQIGPLRLIAPNDQLHSRWVRQVKGVSVVYPPYAPCTLAPKPCRQHKVNMLKKTGHSIRTIRAGNCKNIQACYDLYPRDK